MVQKGKASTLDRVIPLILLRLDYCTRLLAWHGGGGVRWHVITNPGLNPVTTPSSSLHHPNQVSFKPV